MICSFSAERLAQTLTSSAKNWIRGSVSPKSCYRRVSGCGCISAAQTPLNDHRNIKGALDHEGKTTIATIYNKSELL